MKKLFALIALAILVVACEPAKNQVAQTTAIGPVTWIDAPLDGSNLPLKPYSVVSHATFPKGITSFELSVNGQVALSNNISPNQAGQPLVEISQAWNPPAPGTYLLSVRAANAAGVYGSPAEARVTVGDNTSPSTQTRSLPTPTSTTASRPPSPTNTAARPVVSNNSTNTLTPTATVVRSAPPSTATRSAPPPPQPTATFTLPPPVFRMPTATRTNTPVPRDTQGPPPPAQTVPANGASLQCVNVTLMWRSASDPSGIREYDVELQSASGRLAYSTYKSWDNARMTSVTFDPNCYTNYRWRVRATDNAGNVGAWSGYSSFTVTFAPPQ